MPTELPSSLDAMSNYVSRGERKMLMLKMELMPRFGGGPRLYPYFSQMKAQITRTLPKIQIFFTECYEANEEQIKNAKPKDSV